MTVYAIGDVHGQMERLAEALALIEADGGAEAPLVFLGDYVDRGPDSRGVIACLSEGQAAGRPWTVLKGNHDRMFQRFLSEGVVHDAQILSGKGYFHPAIGGDATLASYLDLDAFLEARGQSRQTLAAYGSDPRHRGDLQDLQALASALVPKAHLAWLKALPLTHERGELLFVHAGLRPGIPLEAQSEDDLVWIRGPWLEDKRDHGWLVVHGHTALEAPQHFGNRVDLDGGAGYGRPLIPAVFEGRAAWTLTPEGRVPLVPRSA